MEEPRSSDRPSLDDTAAVLAAQIGVVDVSLNQVVVFDPAINTSNNPIKYGRRSRPLNDKWMIRMRVGGGRGQETEAEAKRWRLTLSPGYRGGERARLSC